MELPEKFRELTSKYRPQFLILLIGLLLITVGGVFTKVNPSTQKTKVEVLSDTTESQSGSTEIVVEIVGEVRSPGVYKLPVGARVDDLINISGGLTESSDTSYVEKAINRAAKLSDGQKLYIPKVGEQSEVITANTSGGYQSGSSDFSTQNSTLININTSSLSELDKLPGIGPVYGQSIIDHRPYSDVGELVSKGAIKDSVYQKLKNQITVY